MRVLRPFAKFASIFLRWAGVNLRFLRGGFFFEDTGSGRDLRRLRGSSRSELRADDLRSEDRADDRELWRLVPSRPPAGLRRRRPAWSVPR